MDKKDWIILLVPIFLNGIILVVFGKYYEYKWDLKKKKENEKQKIEDKFYDLLNYTRAQLYEIKFGLEKNISNGEIIRLAVSFLASLNEMFNYIREYHFILEPYEYTIEKIFDLDIVKEIAVIVENNDVDAKFKMCKYSNKILLLEKEFDKMMKLYLK